MMNKKLAIFALVDLLMRLRRSVAGNTLAMVAAGLVPLTAMIGSGVDMSRAYMVKSRLQQACDAGVLAGRKAMADGEYTTAAKGIAEDYFDINFPNDYMESTNASFTTDNPAGGSTVVGNASVTVPTVIMRMFNIDGMDMAVNCTAQLEIANSDITFVLDNTGSMACPENSNTDQCNRYFVANGYVPVEGVAFEGLSQTSRLAALRTAMDSFYSTIDDAAENSGARVRYAFVPYSQTVNTGYLLQPDHIVNEHSYQSTELETIEYFRSQNPTYTADCDRYFGTWPGYRVYGRYDATYGGCIWDEERRVYRQVTFDVSNYKAGIATQDPTERTSNSYTWAGCIEERDTIGTGAISFDIGSGQFSPSGLFDLDIDGAPFDDATRWRPYWPEISVRRFFGIESTTDVDETRTPQVACPARSATLAQYANLADYQTFNQSLIPDGGTYHDIGLLWGARLSSTTGIFSANVQEAPNNGGFVGRHLVWMTDGDLGASTSAYSSYGIERHDGRITGVVNGESDEYGAQVPNIETRYTELCRAIKAKGIRLWVVAFNTALTTELTDCASPNSSYVANNASELNTAFAIIAEQIAELRLTE
ncbi:TadE/TadG family type IV pilus assembly protein [Alterisphingorhabdus coralli]|uniref:TadE/TadG family type IV pilus assembly protein n=1 Tax=Alterisphingorhabdus coralli TaxID=3071408 RepID=A0AA97F6A5_9SPHN|nr:TadE/TadG family type IV pilus assembly protein [Parasphingorhabdus sp. SCSIO 66989]WOE74078.1 TadE/TadG family type IV pilus assembly protein [Parasphingorhabdus sp. SCSIO 66989]